MNGYKTSASERARVRAYYETACAECGGPCWGRGVPGRRCKECVRLGSKKRSVQRTGLLYQWGCP